MRKIKFRAWDKKRLIMSNFNLTDIYAECNQNTAFLVNAPHEDEFDNWDCFDIMQFTGLFDKNGKEIYAGDLIKKSGETKIQIYNNKEVHSPYWRICKIVFVEGCFKQIIVSQENSYFGGLPSPPADIFKPDVYYEVIGNIYENPELLEVKKGELKRGSTI